MLLCGTDSSYINHIYQNVSGQHPITEDRDTVKRCQGHSENDQNHQRATEGNQEHGSILCCLSSNEVYSQAINGEPI